MKILLISSKKIIKKKSELSSRQKRSILYLFNSYICNLRNSKEKLINKRKPHNEKLTNMIYDIMVDHYFRVGEEPIIQIIHQKYGICISTVKLVELCTKIIYLAKLE